ncbi:hypothetical protein IWQ61_005957 [Dispira simplex]|nr:hypothetical protein IWQ61_005957 [Dispira simplex]
MNVNAPVFVPKNTKSSSQPRVSSVLTQPNINNYGSDVPTPSPVRQRSPMGIAQRGAESSPSRDKAFPRKAKQPVKPHQQQQFTSTDTEYPFLSAPELASSTSAKGKAKSRGNRRNVQSLNHLLNFSLPARQPPAGSSDLQVRRRRLRQKTNYEPYRKERFINANYRFLLNPRGDYTVYCVDPDVPIPWEDVEQVLIATHQPLTCPICLMTPVAPRVTKCGHVYCLPCVTRYLHTSTATTPDAAEQERRRTWKKCPICWDPIYLRDLRSARAWNVWYLPPSSTRPFIEAQTADDEALALNEPLTLRLVQRHPRSILTEPWDSSRIVGHLGLVTDHSAPIPWDFTPSALTFSKLLLASPSYMLEEMQRDQEALRENLAESQSLGDTVLISTLEVCLRDVQSRIDTLAATPANFQELASRREGRQSSLSAELTATTSSSTCDRVTQVKNLGAIDQDEEVHFYYQADDGQHIYLHPLDWRVIQYEFKEQRGQPLPSNLTLMVQWKEETTMTEDLRRRCKYLSHLPLGCDLVFVQVDLQGLISTECYEAFASTLERRRERQLAKLVHEKQEAKLAEVRLQQQRKAERYGMDHGAFGDLLHLQNGGSTLPPSAMDAMAFPTIQQSQSLGSVGNGAQQPSDIVSRDATQSVNGNSPSEDMSTLESPGSNPGLSFAEAIATASHQPQVEPSDFIYDVTQFPSISACSTSDLSRPKPGLVARPTANSKFAHSNLALAETVDDDAICDAYDVLRAHHQAIHDHTLESSPKEDGDVQLDEEYSQLLATLSSSGDELEHTGYDYLEESFDFTVPSKRGDHPKSITTSLSRKESHTLIRPTGLESTSRSDPSWMREVTKLTTAGEQGSTKPSEGKKGKKSKRSKQILFSNAGNRYQ